MKRSVLPYLLVALFVCPALARGQDPSSADPIPSEQTDVSSAADAQTNTGGGKSFFKIIGGDFKGFFSKDTAKVMGVMSVASIAAVPWDREGLREGLELPPAVFKPGKIIGSVLFQGAIGGAAMALGKVMDSDTAIDVGFDLIRGQILSQALVQGLKVVVRRERPDASNRSAFPSGHTASMFATAAVMQRHFGWKAGTPLYAIGMYVATSRMSANKHHISDVVMGAGLGIAAGRTVTIHTVGQKLGITVAPTQGGASLTFTRIPK